ncbi:MAG: ferrous iron transport protein A [Rhodothermaceae bacterium]
MLNRLCYCGNGEKVKVTNFQAGPGARSNLKSYGIKVGSEITVIKNELEKGPVFISLGEEIIELGLEISKKIIVEAEKSTEFRLDQALIGDTVEISKMTARGEIRRRLMDMGIVKGTCMKILRVAPLGDPVELKVSNFNLSLRLNEAETIMVKLIDIDNESVVPLNNAV